MSSDWQITARTRWPDFYVREIWQYRDLLFRFVRRDFLAAHKQTLLGAVWIFLQPLLTAFFYVVIFNRAIGISTDGRPAVLFYLGNVLLWSFFADSLQSIAYTYAGNVYIFNKVYFPRIIVPLSHILSQLTRLLIQLAVFFILLIGMAWYDPSVKPNGYLLLLPLHVALLAAFALGLGLIFAAMTTRYKDLHNLLGFGVRLWMFITPVIYPLSVVPGRYRDWLVLNPLTPVMEFFRYGFLGSGDHTWTYLAYSMVMAAVVLYTGVVVFNFRDGKAMDIV